MILEMTFFEVHIGLMLHRQLGAVWESGESSGVSVQFVVRILVFGHLHIHEAFCKSYPLFSLAKIKYRLQ